MIAKCCSQSQWPCWLFLRGDREILKTEVWQSSLSGIQMLSQPRTPASHRADELSGKRQNSVPWDAHPLISELQSKVRHSKYPVVTFSIHESESYPLSNLSRRPIAPIPLETSRKKDSLYRVGMPNPFLLRFIHYDKEVSWNTFTGLRVHFHSS